MMLGHRLRLGNALVGALAPILRVSALPYCRSHAGVQRDTGGRAGTVGRLQPFGHEVEGTTDAEPQAPSAVLNDLTDVAQDQASHVESLLVRGAGYDQLL